MSEQKVPQKVAEIIAAARARLEEEAHSQQARQQEEQQAMIEKGRQLLQEYIQKRMEDLPDWLREYAQQDLEDVEQLERLGRGWEKCAGSVRINVPGLAPILFDWEKGYYKAACVSWYEYEEEAPGWSFREGQWSESLDYVLVAAQNAFAEMQEKDKQYERLYRERQERRQEWEKQREEAEQHEVKAAQKEANEADTLMDALRDDPVAISLLKVFLAVRNGRRVYEQMAADADEALFASEQRWSRKEKDLRRQTEDAERRAEDERSRAGDLEDDLQAANKKLKQAERGR